MFTVINISLRPFRPNLFSGRSPNGIIGVAGAKCILGSYDLFLIFFSIFLSSFLVSLSLSLCMCVIAGFANTLSIRGVQWNVRENSSYYFFYPSFFSLPSEESIADTNGKWNLEFFIYSLSSLVTRFVFRSKKGVSFLGGKCITRNEFLHEGTFQTFKRIQMVIDL